jgi:hypothetical protein
MTSERWTIRIEEISNAFRNEFGGLSATELNWKPDAETWSITQNLQHIIVLNETYYPVIKKVRDNTYKLPFIAKLGFMVQMIGKIILKAVDPSRRKKMKTFTIWEPLPTEADTSILEQFEKHQEELKKLITQSMDLVEAGTIISSPANRFIIYKLETAFDIIVTHEQRHFEQAKELLTCQHFRK